jgi:hypothetical protein
MAATASCEQSRAAHLALSLGYVARIDALRRANVAEAAK